MQSKDILMNRSVLLLIAIPLTVITTFGMIIFDTFSEYWSIPLALALLSIAGIIDYRRARNAVTHNLPFYDERSSLLRSRALAYSFIFANSMWMFIFIAFEEIQFFTNLSPKYIVGVGFFAMPLIRVVAHLFSNKLKPLK